MIGEIVVFSPFLFHQTISFAPLGSRFFHAYKKYPFE